jgi:stalled ribosome alternative rescue factor ArfA
MYLDGHTYSEIKILARHSLGAIKRYLESFTKVVMCYKRGIYQNRDISAVTGLSQSLINQYVSLIKQSKKDKIRRDNLQQLTERAGYREGIKKNSKGLFEASGSYDRRLIMNINRDRYESIKKRNFHTAVLNLLESEYKILGSRKILDMLADDIENLHREYYPGKDNVGFGEIVFTTTKDDGQRQSYGKKVEDYATVTVVLLLITKEDVERRIYFKKGDRNSNYKHREARDIETMVRLLKSAKTQGGLLSGAELSVIMNRSLTTIQKYLAAYLEKTKEILPLKGYVLDQGSNPTHKAIIISLYEQGISPADIVLKTSHSQEAVDRYIKQYDQIKKLIRKGIDEIGIKEITGRSMKVVKEYIKLYKDLNP